uniref:Glutathione S-transferase n=2 Tax=Panagrolaimus sp. JU765 TaxID=591449 RepID=A0AC34R578_9BILA
MVSYTLIGFPFRGLGETIRLMFHYSGVEFVDKRLTPEQWTAMKPLTPYGQLPILEVDGKPLAQSGAIYRFLAKKFGMNGSDDWEAAQLDSLILMMDDFRNDCREFFGVITGTQKGDKAALFNRQFKPAADKYIPALERALHASGSGFFSKKGVSYVDFYVAEYVDTLNGFLPEFLVKHPALLDHSKRVHDLPQIQKYLSTRPKTAV